MRAALLQWSKVAHVTGELRFEMRAEHVAEVFASKQNLRTLFLPVDMPPNWLGYARQPCTQSLSQQSNNAHHIYTDGKT